MIGSRLKLFGLSALPALLALPAHAGTSVRLQADPDQYISSFVSQRGIKGAAVTIWNPQGKIIWSKGYGSTGSAPFTPDTVCRVASISKIFTSIAFMYAVKEGKIDLDVPINTYLKYPKLGDPRIEKITSRMMLQHISGMESKSVPISSPALITLDLPLTPQRITDWAMTQKMLERDPGTAYAYSNTAYTVLGVILEKATGTDYEKYVKKVLALMGVTKSRIGNTLKSDPDETQYYDLGNRSTHSGVQYGTSMKAQSLPYPYGGAFVLESMPGGGGWASTSNELAKIMIGTFGSNRVFSERQQAEMVAKPSIISGSYYTGLGWNRSLGGTFREGSLECSSACVIWMTNGYGFSYVQNTCTAQDKVSYGSGQFLEGFCAWMNQNAK